MMRAALPESAVAQERPSAAALEAAPRERLGVIVLTYNSAAVIEATLAAAFRLTRSVYAVDSGSTDGTAEILRQFDCKVADRPFKNYADQRNWAIDRYGVETEWQLHLDADEVLDDLAISEVRRVLEAPGENSGFIFKRRTYFLGRPLRFGGTWNFHLRLFKTGTARCEDRLYDQHFISDRPSRRVRGLLHDMNVGNLTEWTARHNRWSDLESAEIDSTKPGGTDQLRARLSEDPRERRRFYKGRYYAAPPFLRALLLFVYRYFLQGGFLDGRAGFLYAFFQVLWFRMLVDAKLHERRMLGPGT